jgi:hypothetical protein
VRALSESSLIGATELVADASMGIGVCPTARMDPGTLLRNGDLVLNRIQEEPHWYDFHNHAQQPVDYETSRRHLWAHHLRVPFSQSS